MKIGRTAKLVNDDCFVIRAWKGYVYMAILAIEPADLLFIQIANLSEGISST
jgi:hypothetical protein